MDSRQVYLVIVSKSIPKESKISAAVAISLYLVNWGDEILLSWLQFA